MLFVCTDFYIIHYFKLVSHKKFKKNLLYKTEKYIDNLEKYMYNLIKNIVYCANLA